MNGNSPTHLSLFEQHRPLLFGIAYRMMGTASEAEDILQDGFIRWQGQPLAKIENPKAFLATVITRLCLNQLSAACTTRETYLGPWLPEPILTDGRPEIADPEGRAAIVDSISIAFLLLLESLTPAERAVYLLHEVFDYKFREIGLIVEKSDVACRQLFHRAKNHMAANRPRFSPSEADSRRLLDTFIKTVESGEIEPFLQMLADDVALVPDGGGQRGAAVHVIRGREGVASFMLGTRRLAPPGLRFEQVTLNNQPAIIGITADNRPFFALFLYAQHSVIQLIHVIAGRKLHGVELTKSE